MPDGNGRRRWRRGNARRGGFDRRALNGNRRGDAFGGAFEIGDKLNPLIENGGRLTAAFFIKTTKSFELLELLQGLLHQNTISREEEPTQRRILSFANQETDLFHYANVDGDRRHDYAGFVD